MVTLAASVEIHGVAFSPTKVVEELGDIFSDVTRIGEIGVKGRYKGRKIPYGSASIKPPNDVKESDHIVWLAHFLSDKIDVIRKNGGEDISISVSYFHDGQCNGALNQEELDKLAALGIPFLFSIYQVEDLNGI